MQLIILLYFLYAPHISGITMRLGWSSFRAAARKLLKPNRT